MSIPAQGCYPFRNKSSLESLAVDKEGIGRSI